MDNKKALSENSIMTLSSRGVLKMGNSYQTKVSNVQVLL